MVPVNNTNDGKSMKSQLLEFSEKRLCLNNPYAISIL